MRATGSFQFIFPPLIPHSIPTYSVQSIYSNYFYQIIFIMTTFVLDPAVNTVASVPRSTRLFQRRQYRDKQFKGGESEWKKKLERSSTVYVGNLSCYTNEYQLYELFTRCGSVKRIIMGLDRNKKTPCGFCFVEFDERVSALKSISYLNRTHLDGRDICVDIDAGFEEGRQYGRGSQGGQIGDERRREQRDQGGGYHGGRGGLQGAVLTRSITIVACLAIISVLIAHQLEPARADIIIKPFGVGPLLRSDGGRYLSPNNVRQAQLSEKRTQFEKNLAQFLVNLMKAAKPTLLKAFIQATLADKQLKEIAIGLFFNNTSTDNDDNDDS